LNFFFFFFPDKQMCWSRSARHVACMQAKGNAYKVFARKPEEATRKMAIKVKVKLFLCLIN
jgi:hypothetical protein